MSEVYKNKNGDLIVKVFERFSPDRNQELMFYVIATQQNQYVRLPLGVLYFPGVYIEYNPFAMQICTESQLETLIKEFELEYVIDENST
jgi:hypothetical protein